MRRCSCVFSAAFHHACHSSLACVALRELGGRQGLEPGIPSAHSYTCYYYLCCRSSRTWRWRWPGPTAWSTPACPTSSRPSSEWSRREAWSGTELSTPVCSQPGVGPNRSSLSCLPPAESTRARWICFCSHAQSSAILRPPSKCHHPLPAGTTLARWTRSCTSGARRRCVGVRVWGLRWRTGTRPWCSYGSLLTCGLTPLAAPIH